MAGHLYPAIHVHDSSVVHAGDQNWSVTKNYGPVCESALLNSNSSADIQIVQLDSESLDVESLLRDLKATSRQCKELKDCLSQSHSATSSQELVQDLDELESLLETLCFHASEDDFQSTSGWQRPLLDLSNVLQHYQQAIQDLRDSLDERAHNSAASVRSDLRDLRLRLGIAIAIITFCAFHGSQNAQTEQMQALDERLRNTLEAIENERASHLPRGNLLVRANMTDVQSARSLMLKRHLRQSLIDDTETLRAASMQVSSFVTSTDSSDNTIASKVPSLIAFSDPLDQGRTIFLHFLCMGDTSARRRTILIHTTQTVFEVKQLMLSQLRSSPPVMAGEVFSLYLDLKNDTQYVFHVYCAFAQLADQCMIGDYLHALRTPMLLCWYSAAPSKPKLQKVRDWLRGSQYIWHDPTVWGWTSAFHSMVKANDDVKLLFSKTLAWAHIAMTNDLESHRHIALAAYINTIQLLTELENSSVWTCDERVGMKDIIVSFSRREKFLDGLKSAFPAYVVATRDWNVNPSGFHFLKGDLLRVMEESHSQNYIRVFPKSLDEYFFEFAWDGLGEWVPFEAVYGIHDVNHTAVQALMKDGRARRKRAAIYVDSTWI